VVRTRALKEHQKKEKKFSKGRSSSMKTPADGSSGGELERSLGESEELEIDPCRSRTPLREGLRGSHACGFIGIEWNPGNLGGDFFF